MKFIIAIEPGDENQAYGVVVPDLPGCFSAGDSFDEALENAKEAIDLWCETVIDDGGLIPESQDFSVHQANPEFAGWVWAMVDVPVERYLGQISLPKLLLSKIDEYVKAHGISRSHFLAQAAQQAMRQ